MSICCGLVAALGLTQPLVGVTSPSPGVTRLSPGVTSPSPDSTGPSLSQRRIDPALGYIRAEFGNFSRSTERLCAVLRLIPRGDGVTIGKAREALIDSRLHYKRVEYFLEYFFHSSALIYNNPAKYEVEEPYQEFEAPRGFQVIESLLFEKDVFSLKERLLQQAVAVKESAKDLGALLFDLAPDDRQLLESLRIELIRVLALGIAGYDAPLLKSGIAESYEALRGMEISLTPYLKTGSREADSTGYYLAKSISLLRANRDFDHFDRLGFLTEAALPLQHHLGSLIKALNLELNTVPALNYDAENLFSRDALDQRAFPHAGTDDDDSLSGLPLIALGRKLFFEKALSGNGSRSCASCHEPGKYFTDGLPKSIALDQHSTVSRNAPSLLYAGFQYSQFWDGRAKSLEEQVAGVLKNPLEMNAGPAELERRMRPLTLKQIERAIASYIRTLAPMNSALDRYLGGDKRAMSPDQIRGFNLFMGKAQCGTCHFAPLFNGLRPPLYAATEYEVLGVPVSDDLAHPRADGDSGRARVYPIPFYTAAFKTPTLRNVAVTGPYMHNGGFRTLEKVMDFYNKGGGKGIGLEAPEQTLPAAALHLSSREIAEITRFLQALTDTRPAG